MNKHQQKIVTDSLVRMAETIDLEVLSLPITIFPDMPGTPPAYTDFRGLFINDNVIKTDPENLHIYLAHELGHNIFRDFDDEFHLDPKVLNVASDYKINQFLYQMYGWDVRKVKFPGLLDEKYFKYSQREIYDKHVGHRPTGHCHAISTSHPLLMRQASILRKRYSGILEPTFDYFLTDLIDSEKFFTVMYKATRGIELECLSFIDVNKVLKGIYDHLVLEKAIATPINRSYALPAETIVHTIPADRYRYFTKENPELALLFAFRFLESVDNDDNHILRQKLTLQRRIDNARNRLHRTRNSTTVEERKDIKRTISHMEKSLQLLEQKIPLPVLLANYFQEVSPPIKPIKTASLAIDKNLEKSEYKMNVVRPKIPRTEITKRLRTHANRTFSLLQRTNEVMVDIMTLLREFNQELPE